MMSVVSPFTVRERLQPQSPAGVRLHRFTVDEYQRMAAYGVFQENDPVELLSGYLFIKLEKGPPYEVPLGIPPEVIAGIDVPQFPQRRFTVKEYQSLMKSGALHPALNTELVEGWVVEKMVRDAVHDATLQVVIDALQERIGKEWKLRIQSATQMDDGQPEPDLAVVPGPSRRFQDMHPRPIDIGLLVEISNATVSYDRGPKMRDYARNNVTRYWLVNINERQVEEYTDPTGPTDCPEFKTRRIYREGDSITLTVRNQTFGLVPVSELMPWNPSQAG